MRPDAAREGKRTIKTEAALKATLKAVGALMTMVLPSNWGKWEALSFDEAPRALKNRLGMCVCVCVRGGRSLCV